MSLLPASHDPAGVAASVLIAFFAAYVALDLARRVRTRDRDVALAWWIGGSVVMGSGVWAMHFIGMLSLELPVRLGWRPLPTALSWLAAVAASAVALGLAARGGLTRIRLLFGSCAMAAGISGMHYVGMAALELEPGIRWNGELVLLSVVVALGASAASLSVFCRLHRDAGPQRRRRQLGAAGVMALAIVGMHYTGMAAAGFPADALCLSADDLGGRGLGLGVGLAAAALLALTLFTSVLDARMQACTTRLARSLRLSNRRLQEANQALQRQALCDPLTGLPNRAWFEQRLDGVLSRGLRTSLPPPRLAVLFVDLDGFKPINDSFGHDVGDQVLRQVAQRLRGAARPGDTVARVGGDEFLLLMEPLRDAHEAVAQARRLIEAVTRPIELAQRRVQLSCSVGIVVHPDEGQDERLVAHADAAMYAAKRAGGATWALYERRMDEGSLEQIELASDLRGALERGELLLHYQPKIDARRGAVCGVEALLRWRHPSRGMVSPALFVPLAERFGLIGALGAWAIDEACRQMGEWQHAGARIRVAVNLSVHQLREDGLVEHVRQALQRHALPASQLLCEITESVAMDDLAATQRTFDGLRRLGVFLAIDDFGTGYSSLACLRQLPATQLKIDRSFVRDLETCEEARSVVDAVIHLSHRLGLVVVAEGVETAGQREQLQRMGCDQMQGYLFARPMPADELLDWALGHRAQAPVAFSPSTVGMLDAA
ncbi:putative bifunctional diguanylate cyclase/phosphodiesterase [Piscinibacter defluvii]|uniref:putative bifunctional diguanylate cyclase/phosphodiesterase n=1 Tax=Piscinibacter defluvii TaxID=1796922 RepID=UPI001F0BD2BC|nr:EAL domain-containing protein [Piscinibacter defluvii]